MRAVHLTESEIFTLIISNRKSIDDYKEIISNDEDLAAITKKEIEDKISRLITINYKLASILNEKDNI